MAVGPALAGMNAYRRFSAIGLYCDLDDRAVDAGIKILPDFLTKSSTNALDRARHEGRPVI